MTFGDVALSGRFPWKGRGMLGGAMPADSPKEGATTSDDRYRVVIERYLAAYNSFDVDGMIAALHPDVEFSNVSGGDVTATAHGREEFRALAERAVSRFARRQQTVLEYGADGETAWVTID